jgi:hypothetical protein
MAVINPERPITEPTDRSIPAVMMTMHSPKAAMAIHEKSRRMLEMLVLFRKVSVEMDRKTIIASRMRNTPNSGRPTTSRQVMPRGCAAASLPPVCIDLTLLMPRLLLNLNC